MWKIACKLHLIHFDTGFVEVNWALRQKPISLWRFSTGTDTWLWLTWQPWIKVCEVIRWWHVSKEGIKSVKDSLCTVNSATADAWSPQDKEARAWKEIAKTLRPTNGVRFLDRPAQAIQAKILSGCGFEQINEHVSVLASSFSTWSGRSTWKLCETERWNAQTLYNT